MVLSGFIKWIQYVLIIVNFLVLAAGVGSIVLGELTLTAKYGTEKISILTDNDIYRLLSILTITGGCLVTLLAIVGFRCILAEDKNIMLSHFLSMLLMLLFFVSVTTLVLVYTNSLHCCGVEGNVTGGRSWFIWKFSSWYRKQKPCRVNLSQVCGLLSDIIEHVPSSCCNSSYTLKDCGFPKDKPEEEKRHYVNFTKDKPALFTTGCLEKLMDRIETKISYINGALAGILIVIFLCAAVSITLRTVIVRHGKTEELNA